MTILYDKNQNPENKVIAGLPLADLDDYWQDIPLHLKEAAIASGWYSVPDELKQSVADERAKLETKAETEAQPLVTDESSVTPKRNRR